MRAFLTTEFGKCQLSLYGLSVITSFRSKVLERSYATGTTKGLPPAFAAKIRRVLFALDQAEGPDDLRQPGFGLHELTGDMAGFWSIVVNRNWRIVFRFDGTSVADVDYVDYH